MDPISMSERALGHPGGCAEGIGEMVVEEPHDSALVEAGQSATQFDLVCWMQFEIAISFDYSMESVVERAKALLGADHPLVQGEELGPAYVEARNGILCR